MRFLNTMVLCIAFVYAALAQGPVCNSNFNVAPKEGMKTTYSPPPNPPAGPTGPSGPPPSGGGGERLIMFVHGLSGNAESWLDVATSTQTQIGASSQIPGYPARKAICLRPTYTENSMDNASLAIQNEFITVGDVGGLVDDLDQTFIVAHSQGGLVSRNLDLSYAEGDIPIAQRRFSGLVTFGTPHRGSLILNNLDQFTQMGENACNGIIAGPAAEGIENTLAFDFLEDLTNIEAIRSKVCYILDTTAIPFFLDELPPTSLEFHTDSPFIAEINNPDQSQVSVLQHKVAFYGIEEQPVLWREIYNLEMKLPNDFDPFEAADDSPLVTRTNEMEAHAEARLDFWQDKVEDYAWIVPSLCQPGMILFAGPVPCILALAQQQDVVETRNEWQTTLNWWQTANDQYRAIIGEIQPASVVETSTCHCDNYVNFQLASVTETEYNGSCLDSGTGGTFSNCQVVNTFVANQVLHWSDGLVPIESQVGYPGAQTEPDPYGNPSSLYLMQGSNHQQMRNDPNTKEKMFNLLEGNFGLWFYIEHD